MSKGPFESCPTLPTGKARRCGYLFTAFAVLAAAVGMVACRRAKGGGKKKGALVIPVVLQEALTRDVATVVRLAGEVRADVEVRVFSLVPERIVKLTFEEGDYVRKGALLASVKPGALYDAVRQAKAGLAAAKTQKRLARIEMERSRKLYRSHTVAIAVVQRAEAQYQATAAQVKQMRAALGGTYSNVSQLTIRAPISGVIGQRFLSKGDMAGPQVPLCTIIKTKKVRIKAMATEFDVVKLKKGQPARVTVPAFKGKVWKGSVDYLSPVLDRMTRSAWVTVIVENEDGDLKPGMFADVLVEVGRRPNITMVHAKALSRWIQADGKTVYHVFKLNGDTAVRSEVEIGVRRGDFIEIVKGVKTGEMIVTLGCHRLRDGTKVKVVRRITAADLAKQKADKSVKASPPVSPPESSDTKSKKKRRKKSAKSRKRKRGEKTRAGRARKRSRSR